MEQARTTIQTQAGTPQAFTSRAKDANAPPFSLGFAALDRVLSGGLVAGSVSLVGGEPGIGKSTLLAQAAIKVAETGAVVLYVTGEESPSQVHRRLERLSANLPPSLQFLDATDAGIIAATLAKHAPKLAIIDSIQSIRHADVTGEAGNPTQIRASASLLNEAAKRSGTAVLLVGQVTKDGDLAGPRLLEHLVDSVLMLEGDRGEELRILRVLKHRFGTTDESAIFTITETGLHELLDPSVRFLQDRPSPISGSAVGCALEGNRSLLCEIQTLVAPAGFGIPARRIVGFDANRIHLLIAVLGRRASCRLADQDVFVNTLGGLKLQDPAMDLALCLALASAAWDQPIRARCLAMGEVSLSGDIRPIPRVDLRLKEAKRLGYTHAIVPASSAKSSVAGMVVLKAATLREAVAHAGLQATQKTARV